MTIEDLHEPLWVSINARLPKYETQVLVVNDDGKYAIAFLRKGDDRWPDEWRIMFSPYDDDIWWNPEHGTIIAWCKLPNIPTFAPFTDKRKAKEVAGILKEHMEVEKGWNIEENKSLIDALKYVIDMLEVE